MDQTTDPAAPRQPDAALSKPIEDIVESWWDDHFPGSPVAQLTAAWNHAFAAKQELKRRLVDLIEGGL